MARSIAAFSFVKAVVLNHANREAKPFFSRQFRHAFRKDRSIPRDVAVWICGIAKHRGSGRVKSFYHKGESPLGNRVHLYVCTYAVGHFAFQLVGVHQIGKATFWPKPGFETVAIPIYPGLRPDTVWPPEHAIIGGRGIDAFAERWTSIRLIE